MDFNEKDKKMATAGAKAVKRRKGLSKTDQHYVDNSKLQDAIMEYKLLVSDAEKRGELKRPKMSEYLGDSIYKIASRLAMKTNFAGYTYRDDMISDAIENCVSYICNYDKSISNNAFAYITQICYFAFLRRIGKEKKQQEIKNAVVRRHGGYNGRSPYPYLDENQQPEESKFTPIEIENEKEDEDLTIAEGFIPTADSKELSKLDAYIG